MTDEAWFDAGAIGEFPEGTLREVTLGRIKIAVSQRDSVYGAISGVCNHVGGPLGQGRLDGDFVVCPWHYWKFHRLDGRGEPGYEADRVPSHAIKVEGGRLWVGREAETPRARHPHPPHPLARTPKREDGPIRILGLSTTAMTAENPRYSTSEDLLAHALSSTTGENGCETQLLKIRDLRFRECEGFYSKSARGQQRVCAITQMDSERSDRRAGTRGHRALDRRSDRPRHTDRRSCARSRKPSRASASGRKRSSPCCCSTSTASRSSTTPSATQPATSCCGTSARSAVSSRSFPHCAFTRLAAQRIWSGMAARFGGDEFAILLVDLKDEAALEPVVQRHGQRHDALRAAGPPDPWCAGDERRIRYRLTRHNGTR